ncbi:MAG: tRNA (guanosine(37)-N1)-methyltransferase TrmD [Flavobacteriales bacterium]|nr:tRNA (guanosine(37)-N1)-methyltransferase TrmD [Flavobacteriales bacterium]
MRIDIITVLPKMLDGPLNQSIMQRAQDANIVEIQIHNLRDYATGKHKSVDDYQYGGGAGMVLMIEPITKCIEYLQEKTLYDEIIYLTPDGDLLNQGMANNLSTLNNLILLCGHYKGIDERVRQTLITKEISIGDYVLSGGELAAAVLTDSIVRLIPGAISDETSALTDSFQDGLIAPPVYTRPADFQGNAVPNVLLSGHEEKINKWRQDQAEKRTIERRPKLDLGDDKT